MTSEHPDEEAFSTLIAIEESSRDLFVSQSNPKPTGNTLPIAYGGFALAFMIQAACKTVQPRYHLFSVLGSFLGPASIDRKIYCRVARTRDTKTFATRVVYAFQILDNGTERMCAQSSIDFHVTEDAMFTYSTPPSSNCQEELEGKSRSPEAILSNGIGQGHIGQSDVEQYLTTFKMVELYFDRRYSASNISAQTVLGLARHLPTSQDDLPIHQRAETEWWRLKTPLSTQPENHAALAFHLDAGLTFLPLHLGRMSLNEAAACSTLDFAIRVLSPNINVADWHLKERKTKAAAGGKTLSEAWLWDREGNLVATMSQTSIMRKPVNQKHAMKL